MEENDDDIYNDETNKTGYVCPKSGRWMCKLHPIIDEFVSKGKEFPRCRQGAGHRTTWIYLDPESK
jgi:hypothetical protein